MGLGNRVGGHNHTGVHPVVPVSELGLMASDTTDATAVRSPSKPNANESPAIGGTGEVGAQG